MKLKLILLSLLVVIAAVAQETPILATGRVHEGFGIWGRAPLTSRRLGIEASYEWRTFLLQYTPGLFSVDQETETFEAGGSLRILKTKRIHVFGSAGVAREYTSFFATFLANPNDRILAAAQRRTGAYGAAAAVFRIAGPLHCQVRYTRRFAADFSEAQGLQFGVAWRF